MQWGFIYLQKCLQKNCFAKVHQKCLQKCAKKDCKSAPKCCKSVPKMFERVRQKNCLAKVLQKCLQKFPKNTTMRRKWKLFKSRTRCNGALLTYKNDCKKTVWQKCTKNVCKSAPKNTTMRWEWLSQSRTRYNAYGALLTSKNVCKSAPKCCKSAQKMFAKMCQKTVGQKSTKNICKSVLKHCKSAPKMFGKVRQKDSLAKVHQKCLQKCAKKYNYEIIMKTF